MARTRGNADVSIFDFWYNSATSIVVCCEQGDSPMGLTNAKLILKNARKPELQPLEVDALADTGSVFLCIPPHVQFQLGLEEVEKKEVTLADGSTKSVSYVGPVELH